MADGYIADNGTWKRITGVYTADNSAWKESRETFVADNSSWKSGHSGAPSVTLTAGASSSAPWSRITYSMTATGVWSGLKISLARVISPTARIVTTLDAFVGTPSGGSTVSVSSKETGVLLPTYTYVIEVAWWGPDNAERTIAEKTIVMAKPPQPINPANKTPITDTAGGKQWTSSRDVSDWESKNLTLGTQWKHTGDLPYIYYYTGQLKPSTTYSVQTRSIVNNIVGDWSPTMTWTTTAPQYTPGTYSIWPTTNTYDKLGWQGSTRDYHYHAYYSSLRGVQRTCAFFNQSDATLITLRDALNKGARITEAWIYLGRPNTTNGSAGAVVPLIAKMSCTYPNAPVALTGNVTGSTGLARGSTDVLVTSSDSGTTMKNWATDIIMGRATGLMLGNTSNSAYYMSLLKSNCCRLRVTIA